LSGLLTSSLLLDMKKPAKELVIRQAMARIIASLGPQAMRTTFFGRIPTQIGHSGVHA
jgi:hypothetical protein